MGGNRNHSGTCQSSMEGRGSLGKVTEPCGAWWRIKETRRRSYDTSGRNIGRKWGCGKLHFGYSQNTLLRSIKGVVGSQLVILVLVYKMLWDQKKILNISLWRIIRLSMKPATSLCPHISLERILVYIVLV